MILKLWLMIIFSSFGLIIAFVSVMAIIHSIKSGKITLTKMSFNEAARIFRKGVFICGILLVFLLIINVLFHGIAALAGGSIEFPPPSNSDEWVTINADDFIEMCLVLIGLVLYCLSIMLIVIGSVFIYLKVKNHSKRKSNTKIS